MKLAGISIRRIGSGNTLGLGIVYGQQMLAISFLWWNWRLDWKGAFRKDWQPTRPIRRGEIGRGDLYDFTVARGLNKTVNKAKKDKYHHLYEKPRESLWKRLKAWMQRKQR